MNTSEASTRMRLVFPSQSISVLRDIPLRTRWSAGSNSAMGTEEEAGNVSHLSPRDMPGSMAQFITNIPLMKGTVPKRLDTCISFFWHFQQHSKL